MAFLLGRYDMRIDKFLKMSRVIKRRTVANEACDAGRVEVNGKPARASYEVKPGDVVAIQFGNRAVKFEVKSVQPVTGKDAAPAMYEMLAEPGEKPGANAKGDSDVQNQDVQ